MTPAAPPSSVHDEGDARARRRRAFGRFLVAHMVAYVPAFVWAVAWIPIAILRNFAHLERVATNEKMVSDFVLRQMIVPVVGVGLLAHLVAIPWIRRPERRWVLAFLGADALLTIAGVVVAIVYWVRLLGVP